MGRCPTCGAILLSTRDQAAFIKALDEPPTPNARLRKLMQLLPQWGSDVVPSPALLRFPDVKRRTGLSRSTMWRMERNGTFPKRIQLTVNTVAWREDDINRWVQARVDDPLLAKQQTPGMRRAMQAAYSATEKQLGKAAVAEARRKKR